MSKKMTMAEISKQLGISKMTVSRYFNGGYVSGENKKNIDAIVKANNYVPNEFARAIRSRSNIIGFVAPRIESYTTSLVIKGALAAASEFKARLLFHATGFDHESECQVIREFNALNGLGTILIPTKQSVTEPYYDSLENLVFIGKDLPNRCCLFYPEERAIDALVASVTDNLSSQDADINGICYIYDERMLSSRTALMTQAVKTYAPHCDFRLSALTDSEDKMQYQVLRLTPQTLYFCSTDNIAIRLYRIAKEQSLIIGKDIWVVGIGDYEFSDLIVPCLSTVAFNYYEMGYQAVAKLITGDFSACEGSFSLKIRESSQFK